VGAVLNARNRGDLEQAVTLIQAVLERAAKEEKAESENEERSAEANQAGGEDVAMLN